MALPFCTSYRDVTLWQPPPQPPQACISIFPHHLTLDAEAVSWGATGPGPRCILRIRFASLAGCRTPMLAPPPHLLVSAPQIQNHPRWKVAPRGPSWCGMTPRLGPCGHTLKGNSITEASEGTWPSEPTAQDTHPEAAGQEPVMTERPGLTPSTGPSVCAEPTVMASEAARLCFPRPLL